MNKKYYFKAIVQWENSAVYGQSHYNMKDCMSELNYFISIYHMGNDVKFIGIKKFNSETNKPVE